MNYILGEARFYFAQCVFNNSYHYAAYDRYEKKRNKTNIFNFIAIFSFYIKIVNIGGQIICLIKA